MQAAMIYWTPAVQEAFGLKGGLQRVTSGCLEGMWLIQQSMSQGEIADAIMRTAHQAAIRCITIPTSGSFAACHRGPGQPSRDVLDSLLQAYSSDSGNYEILEKEFHLLSLFLAALPAHETHELKVRVRRYRAMALRLIISQLPAC